MVEAVALRKVNGLEKLISDYSGIALMSLPFFFLFSSPWEKKRKLLINLKCQTCAFKKNSDYLHFTDKEKDERRSESLMKQHVEKREANGKNMFLPLLTFRMKNERRRGKKIKRKLLSRIIIVCRKLKKNVDTGGGGTLRWRYLSLEMPRYVCKFSSIASLIR